MKKLLFLSASFLLFFGISAQAQNNKTIEQVTAALDNTLLFVQNREFKKDFETETVELGTKLRNYDDYEKLNIAYNEVHDAYNDYLGQIKRDLSEYSKIEEMVKKPQVFAAGYLENFNNVVETYEKDFSPVAEKIKNPGTKGFFIPTTVLVLGIELFQEVVKIIQGRKEEKQESFNAILTIINQQFYNKLKMKAWAELDIPVPTAAAVATTVTTASNKSGDAPKTTAKNESATTATTVDVDTPTFEDLNGWLEFNFVNADGAPEKMSFAKGVSKDIGVEVLRTNKGDVESEKITNNVAYFSSTTQFATGTQFQMKTYNTAGMYVLTQNSDGSIAFLYPFDNDKLGDCATGEKDITVMPSTFVVGKDRNKVTTLPMTDCSTRPPTERYFTIKGNSTRENFVVLLSKSELDIEDLRMTLAQVEGTMDEKLAKIFGDKLVNPDEANVSIENNRMKFSSFAADKSVLPVVFYINRK